jgi:Na+-transporting NADH:ubiquinone oxidoreductase subunit C
MQKDDLNTIKFAVIVCLVCSMSLAGVQAVLGGKQKENKRIDQQVNVLKALFPDFDPDGNALDPEKQDLYFTQGKVPKEWISRYFNDFVTQQDVELPEGHSSVLYTLTKDGAVQAYAFPAEGKGLWSTVHSYVGLEPDLATVRGVTFFDHGETPGLGGECSKPWFQRNFRGKVLWSKEGPVNLQVAKGKAEAGNLHQVDGMSGATITGNGIQRLVNKTFQAYEETVFAAKRSGEESRPVETSSPVHAL